MFQKIAKHRANDASNDVHRPPLAVCQTIGTTSTFRLPLKTYIMVQPSDWEGRRQVGAVLTLFWPPEVGRGRQNAFR